MGFICYLQFAMIVVYSWVQVTAVVKYWLGGPDPLDYISMFGNPGTQVLPYYLETKEDM